MVDCSVLANLSENSAEDFRWNWEMAPDWVDYCCNLHLSARSVVVVVQDWDLTFVLADNHLAVDIVEEDNFVELAVNMILGLVVGLLFDHNYSVQG